MVRDGADAPPHYEGRTWRRSFDLILRGGRSPRLEGWAQERFHGTTSHSRGTIASGFCPIPLSEGQGMPGAGRTRGSCVQKKMHTAHASNTGSAEQPAFPAQWLYGLSRALLGVPGLIASVALGLVTPWLDPSIGGPGPRAFAVRAGAFVSCVVAAIASRATFRDDREAPLQRARDGADHKGDLGF